MVKKVAIVVATLLSSAVAFAQESRSEISVQGTGLFTKDSEGRGTQQRGTDAGGLLVGSVPLQSLAGGGGSLRLHSQHAGVPYGGWGLEGADQCPLGDRGICVESSHSSKVQNPPLRAGGRWRTDLRSDRQYVWNCCGSAQADSRSLQLRCHGQLSAL